MTTISQILSAGQCLELGILDGNIALITFGRLDSRVNAAHSLFFAELEKQLEILRTRPELKGLIFQSKLPGFFIAGADLKEFASKRGQKGKVEEIIRLGVRLIAMVESLPFPTLAMVDGACLGGGLEIALGFDYRYASSKAELGLPESKLGLIPGWGGTQRLPRLIGLDPALDLLFTGRALKASEALEKGIVDAIISQENLLAMAVKKILETQTDGAWSRARARKIQPVQLGAEELSWALASWKKNTSCHPFLVGEFTGLLARSSTLPLEEAIQLETLSFLKSWDDPLGKNQVDLFFLKQGISKDLSKTILAHEIDSIGVVGSGMFGPKIAETFARKGFNTMLIDRVPVNLGRGTTFIIDEIHRNLQVGGGPQKELLEILGRLSTSTVLHSLADRQFVLEAAVENEQIKAAIFRDLASFLPANAYIATNTNTLSITRLAREVKNPANFAGFHFVSKIFPNELVEIVPGEKTSDECMAALKRIARRLGKVPLVVRDVPGFLAFRLFLPLMQEAEWLVEEGANPAWIDQVLKDFGWRMGFFEFLDLLGLDAYLFLAEAILPNNGAPHPKVVQGMVNKGRTGSNTEQGFWLYTNGHRKADPELPDVLRGIRGPEKTFTPDEVLNRLLLRGLIEASKAAQEKIVATSAEVDLGMVLSFGFPVRVGGPFHWADALGWQAVDQQLQKYGPMGGRFNATPWLQEKMAKGLPCLAYD